MHNQRASSSSSFQRQQMVQPPTEEQLLFNDIIQEKSLILRDLMDKFLQVHPFSRFESEFNLFAKRIKHIARDGQRNGLTRQLMQMPSYYGAQPFDNGAQPSSRPTGSGESQETNKQHAEPANVFKRPSAASYKPRTTLTHNNQYDNIPTTTNSCDTIVEESLINNHDAQQPEFIPSTAPIPCSESPQVDNASPTTFNNGNDDNTMESVEPMECVEPMESVESVESVEIPNTSVNSSASQLSQDQLNWPEKSKVKNLTKWSINIKQIKSNKGNSKPVITLSGTLLAGDKITVLKKVHKAGILVVRKTKNIVKTDNGLYHLIGPIIEGSPHNLFRSCVEINGIPKTWRSILTHLSTEVETNLNESMTRKGTVYNKKKEASHNSSETKASFGRDLLNDIDFRRQLTQLSTPRTMKAFEVCHTPSQLLKQKFHRKFVKACLIIDSQNNSDEMNRSFQQQG